MSSYAVLQRIVQRLQERATHFAMQAARCHDGDSPEHQAYMMKAATLIEIADAIDMENCE